MNEIKSSAQVEAMSSKELESEILKTRRPLIRELLQAAKQLDNRSDVESLSAFDIDGEGFDLSEYWGYNTRSDAQPSLQNRTKYYELLQGTYFERQAALELSEQQQAKVRRGWVLIGSIGLLVLLLSAWAHFIPNRFTIDLRKRNLKRLTFAPSFNVHAGQSLTSIIQQFSPPPGTFAPSTNSFEKLRNRAKGSPFAARATLWLRQDQAGKQQGGWLTGHPNHIIRKQLLKPLLEGLLLSPLHKENLFVSGVQFIPQKDLQRLLPHFRSIQMRSGMLQIVTFQKQHILQATRQIHRACQTNHTQNLSFAKMLQANQQKYSKSSLLVHPVLACGKGHTIKGIELKFSVGSLAPKLFKKLKKGYQATLLDIGLSRPTQRKQYRHLSILQQLSHASLWDSALRNVPPPVAQLSSAYTTWHRIIRRRLWLIVYRQLIAQKIPMRSLDHPHIIFRVHSENNSLFVRPFWVVDLATHTLQFRPSHPVPVWKRLQQTPKAHNQETPPVPMGFFASRFPKLQNQQGIQALLSAGILYPTFERLWRANVPVHSQFAKIPKWGRATTAFARQGKTVRETQKLLMSYVLLRRAAHYLRQTERPKVGYVFRWLKQIPHQTIETRELISRIRRSIGLLTFHTPIYKLSLRRKIARRLRNAAAHLMEQLKKQLRSHHEENQVPPLRLLRARVNSERGQYKKALQLLLQKKELLAFYHPRLRFKVLKGDALGPLHSWDVSLSQKETHHNGIPAPPKLLIKASSGPQQTLRPVLLLEDLPEGEGSELMKKINDALRQRRKPKSGTLSEQLLMLSIPIRKEIRELYQRLREPNTLKRLALELAFGCYPPHASNIPPSDLCKHPFFRPPTMLQFGSPFKVRANPPNKQTKGIAGQGSTKKKRAPTQEIPSPTRKGRGKALIQIP